MVDQDATAGVSGFQFAVDDLLQGSRKPSSLYSELECRWSGRPGEKGAMAGKGFEAIGEEMGEQTKERRARNVGRRFAGGTGLEKHK